VRFVVICEDAQARWQRWGLRPQQQAKGAGYTAAVHAAINRVGGGLTPPPSHTTVRAVRHTVRRDAQLVSVSSLTRLP
jgi:hypothetical protein